MASRSTAGTTYSAAFISRSRILASQGKRPARNARGNEKARSADFGVLAAIQPHDVGVAVALRLCEVGVLVAVQWCDTEAAPEEQLAQVPYPAHARERGR